MNSEDIKQLAELSRLKLSDGDIDSYQKDFNGILGYINAIQDVSIDADDSIRPLHVNVLREDDISYESGQYTRDLIDAAPKKEGDYVRVNKVL